MRLPAAELAWFAAAIACGGVAAPVLGSCLAWGIDKNLARKVSLADATWVASIQGLVAGSVNLALAMATGASLPSGPMIGAATLVGLFAYGLSLSPFVVALHLTEYHDHVHAHEELEHEHEHVHDAHHQHAHDEPIAEGTRHTHRHRHAAMVHRHAHAPDIHHRHKH